MMSIESTYNKSSFWRSIHMTGNDVFLVSFILVFQAYHSCNRFIHHILLYIKASALIKELLWITFIHNFP